MALRGERVDSSQSVEESRVESSRVAESSLTLYSTYSCNFNPIFLILKKLEVKTRALLVKEEVPELLLLFFLSWLRNDETFFNDWLCHLGVLCV